MGLRPKSLTEPKIHPGSVPFCQLYQTAERTEAEDST